MTKRLYKSNEKVLFGVCGGIANYFNIDPVIVRLALIVLTAIWGTGLLCYIIAALIIPNAPLNEYEREVYERTQSTNENDDEFDAHFKN